ncbi:MAG: hypothetical protein M0P64_01195 [Candidatus Pacebacteria bacterium]|jgi:hypothetical protein|nr:hypothetical protein [Candidatus Paceibacterota bacterium]
MSKRNLIIITVVILSLLGGGAYWYYSQKGALPGGDILFPGGSGTRTDGGGTTTEQPTDEDTFTPGVDTRLPRLYQLHITPTSGVGFFEAKDKKGVVTNRTVRYVERGLGHIFETQLSTYVESRIVNETRPRISEALWGNSGNSVVFRFLDTTEGATIKTRIINLSSPFATSSSEFLTTEELYLPDSIPFMATAEDGTNGLFYLAEKDGTFTTFQNLNASKIFNSVFTEWLPQFPSQKLVTLTSRPSEKVPGHMFFLDPKTKAVTKILGNINGLTTLTSHDGKFVLASESRNGAPELSVYDVTKKTMLPIYLRGLPEKCVWGTKNPTLVYCGVPEALTNASYPDQWYQGVVSFSDSLWEINAETLAVRKVFTPKDFKAPALDMTNLSLSSDDAYLVFINKLTSTPWVYSIVEPLPPPTPITVPVAGTSTPVGSTSTLTGTTTRAAVPPSVVTSDMQKLK